MTRLSDSRAEQTRQAVLAVLRAAAGSPMSTTEVEGRLLDIGETPHGADVIYSLNILSRGPSVVRVGRRGTSASGEVVWAYRIPDGDCRQLDEE